LTVGPYEGSQRRSRFDPSIAGKTYVNLNDDGRERVIDAGRA
jgi:hypothetical protein